MKRLLFGQSYFLRFDRKLWRVMQPYPPLGCLIAASCVRRLGFEVDFFDSMLASSEQSWQEALDQSQPAFAVLFEDNFNYLSKMCLLRMREAGLAMVKLAKARDTKVIVCGADASDHPEIYLSAGADFVILGEGEETLQELLIRMSGETRTPFESIRGLAFGSASGKIVRTQPRPVIRDLESLPGAAWDLVDLDMYRRIWKERQGYFSLNLVTTRGCPYHCNWCAKPIWGQTYHVRNPLAVAREMAILKESYGVEHIWFADDIMGLKPGWFAGFAKALRETGILVPFKCLSRADLILRPGEVEAMQQAGARTVWLGAESGSQQILDAMDKGITVEQIHAATASLRSAGIEVGFFLQFGYPGEGRSEIEATLEMVRQCAPDEIGISVSYPLPGTRFFEMVRQELSQKQNWVDSEDLDMLYRGPFASEFYRCLYDVVHGEFALNRHLNRMLQRRFRDWRLSCLKDPLAWGYRRLRLPWDRRRLEHLARKKGPRDSNSQGEGVQGNDIVCRSPAPSGDVPDLSCNC